MPLDPRMIYAAVHIEGDRGQGTGFLAHVPSKRIPGHIWAYVLTAHHVIEGQTEIRVQAANALGPGELYEPLLIDDWRQPLEGVDLALAPFPQTYRNIFSAPVEDYMIPTEQVPYVRPGELIYYIGLFAPAGRMMVRTGRAGAIDVPWHSESEEKGASVYDYPAHLIDCRSYGGFSGSPCFAGLEYPGLTPKPPPVPHPQGEEYPPVGHMNYLALPCGMFTEHYCDAEELTLNRDGTISRYGVGVMVRGDEIREALLSLEMKAERERWDRALLAEQAAQPKVAARRASAGPAGGEGGPTADLLGKLLQVPKDEAAE